MTSVENSKNDRDFDADENIADKLIESIFLEIGITSMKEEEHTDEKYDITFEKKAVQYCCVQCRLKEKKDENEIISLQYCSRCKVASYCSRACQKKHYKFHKQYCQFIFYQQQQFIDKSDDETKLVLGNAFVKMGYRETDTIQNGTLYYYRAIDYYYQLLKGGENNNTVNDQLCLLIAMVVPSIKDVQAIFNFVRKKQQRNTTISWHCLTILIQMRRLAEYHKIDNDSLCTHDDDDTVILSSQAIKKSKAWLEKDSSTKNYFSHLQTNIPFLPLHAAYLLVPSSSIDIPDEFWHLFQDYFFLTPQMNTILMEYFDADD